MKDILDKISSYNLFNYLLPGVLFVVALGKVTTYSYALDNNLVVGAFICYFVGLVISRFGSLVVEPALRKISFLKFADYADFVSASKSDPKIEILSEINNMYRTLIAMFSLLVLVKLYDWIGSTLPSIRAWDPYILIALLLVMFLYSYRKQTQYITKRIKTNIQK